jgi:hypothetical protein
LTTSKRGEGKMPRKMVAAAAIRATAVISGVAPASPSGDQPLMALTVRGGVVGRVTSMRSIHMIATTRR